MHSEAQTIARLKSMVFLVEEALRIADEGDNPLLGAKLSDCIDCIKNALTLTQDGSHSVHDINPVNDTGSNGSTTFSV